MRIALLLSSLLLLSQTSYAATPSWPEVAFSGDIMLDYDNYAANFLEKATTGDADAELRRFRLKAESDLNRHWQAKLSIELSDGLSIKDAWLNYSGWQFADMTFGLQKEPFGLAQLTSSSNLLLIERSVVSEALSPSRAHGVKLSNTFGNLNWQLGYFIHDQDEQERAITGRISWAAYATDDSLLHVGSSFSQRDYQGSLFRINETLQVHSADSLIEGTAFNANNAWLTALDMLWQHKGFMLLAEWQQTDINSTFAQQYQYSGGYFEMSYLLSGQNRKYKNGSLGGISRKKDWELTAGISRFNLTQEQSRATVYSVGLNYYPSKNIKLMANILNAEYIEQAKALGSGNAVSLRTQLNF
ncbi:OprO/OprP family phosphate-selective porin [Rheinheimera sp. UJ51]|uniref:OprO/OprP family phosphate-selective porin n=1 Tax=Rheinheimera sp. UJ51 TaxID=2892446 RepID=UPI001E3DFE20|nr:porin [Rheinheimera sp. UJ51]MCC5451055.1 OprO/OprP family phosphate-selective porin [Rheinheimera sp. UJ51]